MNKQREMTKKELSDTQLECYVRSIRSDKKYAIAVNADLGDDYLACHIGAYLAYNVKTLPLPGDVSGVFFEQHVENEVSELLWDVNETIAVPTTLIMTSVRQFYLARCAVINSAITRDCFETIGKITGFVSPKIAAHIADV